jgi:serine/threonine-protein kinase HipA
MPPITDDHARNHAAFWDGKVLSLTPAYDICPQGRTGNEATQAMLITGETRQSRLAVCLAAAPQFLLSETEALEIIEGQVRAIDKHWEDACDLAKLSEVDRKLLWGRQFLNSHAFDDLDGKAGAIAALGTEVLGRQISGSPFHASAIKNPRP